MSKNTYIQTQVQNADIFLSLYQGAAQHMILFKNQTQSKPQENSENYTRG